MIYKLLLSIIFSFLYGWFAHYPLYAQSSIVNDQPVKISDKEQKPPPPLGPACSGVGGPGGGLPVDFENPTCCVSGYVYLNGASARDASVTVTAPNGVQVTVDTPVAKPSYQLAVNLNSMDVTVGDTINISVDSYTVIEQDGELYEYADKANSPIASFEKTITDPDEELIYDISPLELGNLDIHTNETVTIITTYTVRSGGEQDTRQDTTTIQIPDPSFNMTLNDPPLNVKPDDRVTLTVKLGDAQETEVFTARSGSIQVDVVMPNTHVNSRWVSNYLSNREDHAIAYDAANEQMVLFGGRDATGSVLNDTWVRESKNDAQWVQIPTTISPPPRSGHTLLYHDRYEVVLLFGGQNDEGIYLNDLWSWNGTKWHELFIGGPVPSGRSHHSIAYDAKREHVVLFGGRNTNEVMNDTWIFLSIGDLEGGFWLEFDLEQSPPPRQRHAMTYAIIEEKNEGGEEAGTVVLFGGRSGLEEEAEPLNDTWLWSGSRWEPQTYPGPSARESHSLVSIIENQGAYLFGGNNSSAEALDELWFWNGASWIQIAKATEWPTKRGNHAGAYDQTREELLIIGGRQAVSPTDYLTDAWHFTPSTSTWQQADNPQPDFIGWQGTAMAHEQGNQFLIFGGLAETLQANTYRWQPTGWQTLNPQNHPPARYHHTLTSGNAPEVLLFGGINDANNYLNDTWLWNGQDWLLQNPSQSPQPRIHYALTYDKQHNEWLLFGGIDQAGNALGDLWSYAGTTWEQRAPTNSPPARKGATLVYDTKQQAILLFGGQNGEQYFNDLWAWNGTAWERQTPSSKIPEPRANHGAAYYDGQEKQMIISGGQGANGGRLDTWAWDGFMWHEHYTNPGLFLNILSSLHYHRTPDEIDQLIGMGTLNGEAALGNMLLSYQIVDVPISTINYLAPKALYQHEAIYFSGSGADTDESNLIMAHRWTHNGVVISEKDTFTMTAKFLPLGVQSIHYAVQDDEGNWSEEQVEKVYIQESERIYLPTIMR